MKHVTKAICLTVLMAPLLALATGGPTYSVPTRGVVDPAVATFATPDASLTHVDGHYLLNYTLPVDLYGTPSKLVRVFLSSVSEQLDSFGFIELTDGTTSASCELDESRVMCLIHYTFYAKMDPEIASQYLQQKYPHDPKLSDRIQLAKAFISDPAGILEIPKP